MWYGSNKTLTRFTPYWYSGFEINWEVIQSHHYRVFIEGWIILVSGAYKSLVGKYWVLTETY